jgi:hypothetical protein
MKDCPEYGEYVSMWLKKWTDPPTFIPLPAFELKDEFDEVVDDDVEELNDGYDGEIDEEDA